MAELRACLPNDVFLMVEIDGEKIELLMYQ